MHRTLAAIAAVAIALTAFSADAATQCRDTKGKFTKCPPPAAAPQKCRDKTTKKFAKCGGPNTEPVPAKAKPAP
jgi:hypothetical protein